MRFSIVPLVALSMTVVSLAAALPDCAVTCIAETNFGDCAPTDNVCLCNNEVFISGISYCIKATCSAADQVVAFQGVDELCESVGVTLPDYK
ncbi:hypothetical protein C8J56DRAFT_1056213 [Mycena floridula]|nr:hypothetical protein C8J56DRAFT_1056213 [Mycena floridula]